MHTCAPLESCSQSGARDKERRPVLQPGQAGCVLWLHVQLVVGEDTELLRVSDCTSPLSTCLNFHSCWIWTTSVRMAAILRCMSADGAALQWLIMKRDVHTQA